MRKLYIAAVALLLSACTSAETEQTGFDSTTPPQTETPGQPTEEETPGQPTEEETAEDNRLDTTTVLHLAEEEDSDVGDIQLSEPIIFRTADEWNAWFDATIPESLHDSDMSIPSFDQAAVVAGSYPRCTQQSFLSLEADEIFFHIASPEGEEHVDCAWSPNQVIAYEFSLDQFNDPAAVALHPEYIYGLER